MTSPSVLYGLLVLMLLCWSGNYIAAKVVLREIPALLAMILRTGVAAVLMIPIYWWRGRGSAAKWSGREIATLLGLGIGGTVGNQFFWTLGIARTTVVHSSMIVATVPVWVLAMAAIIGLERITLPKVLGIAIALCGVVLLTFSRAAAATRAASMAGDLLIVLCALFLAGNTAFGKKFQPLSGPIAVTAAGYIGGALLLLPVFWFGERGFDFSHVSRAAWAGVLYMGAISSVTGYMIYYFTLAHIPASRMAAFQYLQPVFASLMAVVLLGEDLTATALAAGGVIFTGVLVTERFG
ncbi:MAG: DMT family transporter [Acidobacteriota bacterium]|nr:DMT family transporter [Acidobacteriota bacterium]